MKLFFLGTFIFLSLSTQLLAAETSSYACTKGELKRKIEIKYTTQGQKVPCDVVYYKEGDAEGKVKWSYKHEEGQCEKQAEAFSKKLETLGWSCKAQ